MTFPPAPTCPTATEWILLPHVPRLFALRGLLRRARDPAHGVDPLMMLAIETSAISSAFLGSRRTSAPAGDPLWWPDYRAALITNICTAFKGAAHEDVELFLTAVHRRQARLDLRDAQLHLPLARPDARFILSGRPTRMRGCRGSGRGRGRVAFAAYLLRRADAMRALADAGRRIPDDVAVVGFDDLPAASMTNPPLTTLMQDLKGAGELLVEALLAQIEDRPEPPATLPARLVIRRSSGS